jgi:hypothetical protein
MSVIKTNTTRRWKKSDKKLIEAALEILTWQLLVRIEIALTTPIWKPLASAHSQIQDVNRKIYSHLKLQKDQENLPKGHHVEAQVAKKEVVILSKRKEKKDVVLKDKMTTTVVTTTVDTSGPKEKVMTGTHVVDRQMKAEGRETLKVIIAIEFLFNVLKNQRGTYVIL